MKKGIFGLTLVALIALVVGLAMREHAGFLSSISRGTVVGYVATADKKVYAIDILAGAVINASTPIEGLGRPTVIEYVPRKAMLFVGSARDKNQNDYYPLVALKSDDEFKVAKTYTLDPNGDEELHTESLNPNRSAVYRIVASPDGRMLYLGYADTQAAATTIFDTASAKIVGRTNVPVQLGDYVSADGTLVAEVWPSGSREIQEDGASRFEQWRGGTLVRNIATGDVESRTELIDDQGLHSPWLTELVPFLYVKPGQSQLFIYDPTNGKKTVMDLQALTSWTVAQNAPALLPGSKLAALSMVDGDQHGYVLVVDLVSRQVRSAIEVGPSPTNLVLARKEH